MEQPGPGGDDHLTVKQASIAQLRTIEGQVRAMHRMVADDEPCIDVLTQVSAATGALRSMALGLLADHLHQCVAQAVGQSDDVVEAKVREATDAIARLVITGRPIGRWP